MAEEISFTVEESDEQQVTPWKAQAAKGKSSIDYDKLISKFWQLEKKQQKNYNYQHNN